MSCFYFTVSFLVNKRVRKFTRCSQVPLQFTIQQMCLLRLLPIGIQLLLIVVSSAGLIAPTSLLC